PSVQAFSPRPAVPPMAAAKLKYTQAPIAKELPANPLPPPTGRSKPAPAIAKTEPPINWEQFMGAKLFAWIGGFALFLGVAFFVKYSFEHNLVPPEVRVAIGFLVGIGLLIGGVRMKRKETAVTSQTLCSTGVVIL